MAAADADGEIDIGPLEVVQLRRRFDPQPQIRMVCREAIEPMDQPARGEDRSDRDRQALLVALAGDGHCIVQREKAFLQARGQPLAECGQLQAARRAVKERPPKLFLRAGKLLADGADGDAQFLGRRLQGAKPRHRLDRPEPVQMNRIEISHRDFL